MSDLPRGCERVRFGSILLGLKSSFWQPSFEYELERFPKIIGFLLVKSNLKVDEGGVGGWSQQLASRWKTRGGHPTADATGAEALAEGPAVCVLQAEATFEKL